MSLVGVKAKNHPQQTSARGAKDEVDDRATDPAFFADLAARFGGFTLDVAAAEHNTKCDRFFSIEDDGLGQAWSGERVWCNPPYSNIRAWVEKAWSEWEGPQPPLLIVMILPANRTEQKWWQELVEPRRDRPDSPLGVQFLPGRLRFDRPGWTPGPKGNRPPFGSVLLVWDEAAA